MTPRFAVLGAGAIGAPIGGLLTRAGHDVTLIDQWPAHVDAMQEHGLRVTVGDRERPESDETLAVRASHVHEVCTIKDPFDIVFLACKSYDTRWMVQLIEPLLKDDGVIVSVQNSLNDEWIVPIVGPRDIGCTLTAGGELLAPGHAWRNRSMGYHYYTIGELDGTITDRVQAVAKVLGDAGKTTVSDNIRAAKWSKLVTNCASAAMSGLVDPERREWDLVDIPEWRSASARLYQEGTRVGDALGYEMEPLFGMTAEELLASPDEIVGRLMDAKSRGASRGATTMIQQDLRKGRPTEVVGYFNGLMVRKGREAGVPTPANEAMTEMYVRIERGDLKPSLDNMRLLEELSVVRAANAATASRT